MAMVREALRAAMKKLAAAGIAVEEATPDRQSVGRSSACCAPRGFAASLKGEYDNHRDLLKPEVIWNIEKGLALDAGAIGQAEKGRGQLYHRVLAFLQKYDLLLVPAAILPPAT